MNRRELLSGGAILAIAYFFSPPSSAKAPNTASPAPIPPVARQEPHRIEQLGRVRIDEYAWMRDPDYQKVFKNPALLRGDIRAHLETENAYSEALLAETKALQSQLAEEMRGRIIREDMTAPCLDGPWEYFARYSADSDQPRFVRRPRGRTGPEHTLYDAQADAKGQGFFNIFRSEHSSDHTLFVYALDRQGSENYTLCIVDLATGQTLPDPPTNAHGSFVSSPDARWLFWIGRDDDGRPTRLLRRPLRGTSADDELVYTETDSRLSLTVALSSDRQFILLVSKNYQTSETWVIPASDPAAAPRPLLPRRDGVIYHVDSSGPTFFILTNADDAFDNKILTAPVSAPLQTRELVPHRSGRFIAKIIPYPHHIVRLERVDAQDSIVVRTDAGREEVLHFDQSICALTLEDVQETAASLMRFTLQSPVTPREWYDYDLATGRRTLVKRDRVPGFASQRYEVRRVFATADDGENIPITAIMLRGTPLDGSRPLHLFGYGAYGYPIEPTFSNANISLLDRGWIVALTHIRGGSEKGRHWFLDGRKFKKKNSFTDYITCAEHLCRIGYTRPGRILAYGRSAGGMLMGAILNMQPELWAGVLTGVPFVDVLNTMSDVTLPLTPYEWPEWGNPLNDPAAYDYIASYSPYDNVRPAHYPPVLATCGLTDPRVTYWEPAKWVARLRAANTGPNPILLRIDMTAGHAGATGRFDALRDAALNHAFALWAMARTEKV